MQVYPLAQTSTSSESRTTPTKIPLFTSVAITLAVIHSLHDASSKVVLEATYFLHRTAASRNEMRARHRQKKDHGPKPGDHLLTLSILAHPLNPYSPVPDNSNIPPTQSCHRPLLTAPMQSFAVGRTGKLGFIDNSLYSIRLDMCCSNSCNCDIAPRCETDRWRHVGK